MKMQFVGLKHIKGDSAKTGKPFDFYVACLVSPMDKKDVEKGSVGQDVHTPTVSDRFVNILSESNIGKEVDCEFYYANGRENIGYCALVEK